MAQVERRLVALGDRLQVDGLLLDRLVRIAAELGDDGADRLLIAIGRLARHVEGAFGIVELGLRGIALAARSAWRPYSFWAKESWAFIAARSACFCR